MAGKFKLIRLLPLGAMLGVLLGCGAVPTPQTADVVITPAIAESEHAPAEPEKPEPVVRPVRAESGLPKTATAESSDPDSLALEVGYKIGMRAPEFSMSLNDGTKVASLDLANQGKPTLLYFHATW